VRRQLGHVPHDHFGRLLVVLLALFVVSGFPDSRLIRAASGVLYLVAVLLAMRTSGSRSFRWVHRVIVFGVLALAAVVLAPLEGDTAQGAAAICTAVVAFGALAAVLSRVVRHAEVGVQTIAGALCAYLLIGFMFSSAYAAIDLLDSSPFFSHAVDTNDYAYFSFITLTTTGFGDLTPVTDLGRRVVVLEAMAGQVFLATMVARLVALYRPGVRPGGGAGTTS
jgi:hypothetical protein